MKKKRVELILKVMLYIGFFSIIANIILFSGKPNAISWIGLGILFIPLAHYGITEQ